MEDEVEKEKPVFEVGDEVKLKKYKKIKGAMELRGLAKSDYFTDYIKIEDRSYRSYSPFVNYVYKIDNKWWPNSCIKKKKQTIKIKIEGLKVGDFVIIKSKKEIDKLTGSTNRYLGVYLPDDMVNYYDTIQEITTIHQFDLAVQVKDNEWWWPIDFVRMLDDKNYLKE